MVDYAPGMRIIRDEEWIVKKIETNKLLWGWSRGNLEIEKSHVQANVVKEMVVFIYGMWKWNSGLGNKLTGNL